MRIVVTLVTSLLPQLLVFQVVLQGGNGNKGKKLYVGQLHFGNFLRFFVIKCTRSGVEKLKNGTIRRIFNKIICEL